MKTQNLLLAIAIFSVIIIAPEIISKFFNLPTWLSNIIPAFIVAVYVYLIGDEK
jgi:hypothetical protein